jgi:hypothetical protein
MAAPLFSKRKIVRAVKENMARMCSANWKCILSSGDVCAGEGVGRMRGDTVRGCRRE